MVRRWTLWTMCIKGSQRQLSWEKMYGIYSRYEPTAILIELVAQQWLFVMSQVSKMKAEKSTSQLYYQQMIRESGILDVALNKIVFVCVPPVFIQVHDHSLLWRCFEAFFLTTKHTLVAEKFWALSLRFFVLFLYSVWVIPLFTLIDSACLKL